MKLKTMSYLLCFLIAINTFYGCDEVDNENTGEIVFWKFTDLLDCGPVEVNVIIDDKSVGTIYYDFQPYDSIPDCGSENCLTVTKAIGTYNYLAECYCGTHKTKIGYWSDTFEVKQDSCTKIYLDFREIQEL